MSNARRTSTELLTRLGLLASLVCSLALSPGSAEGQLAKDTQRRDRRWLEAREAPIEVLFGYDAPPSAFHDERGRYVGLLVDVQRELERELGYRFRTRKLPTWQALLEHAKVSRGYVIVGIAPTKERLAYLRFSNAFIKVPYVIVTRRSRQWRELSELRGARVCAVSRYAVMAWLRRHHRELTLFGVKDDLEGLRAVSAGRCDAMVVNQMYASYLIEAKGISNLRFGGESGYVNRLGVAVSIHDHALFTIIDRAVDRIPRAKHRRLYRRWVAPTSSGLSGRIWGWLGLIAGALLVSFVLLWLWSTSLRRQVRKRTLDLAQSERRFRTLFDNISDPVLLQELEGGRVVDANSAALQRYGLKRRERGKRRVDAAPPEPWEETASRMRSLESAKEVIFETSHVAGDGTAFPVWVRGRLVDSEDTPLLLSVCRDLTELKAMEEERQEHEAQLRRSQRLHAMGEFAGGVAHDLNNLLTPIMGFAELLLDDVGDDPEMLDSVEQILAASEKAQVLLRRLLALGRKQPLRLEAVDLNKVIEDFERFLRRTLRDDIDLDLDLASELPAVRADSSQLEQIVMNLAQNAQHAMPRGGRLVIRTEETAAQPEGHGGGDQPWLLLEVSDDGQGMTEETVEHLFEPFFSTKGEQGSGLGLAVVYGILEQHGGHVEVNTAPGEGTTFRLFLPTSDEVAGTPALLQQRPGQERGRETILVVEDSQQVRLLTTNVLRKHGYRLLSAADGHEALRISDGFDEPIDLLLSDVIMPGLDGKALYEELATRRPGLKVLYMSGYTAEVIATRGILDEDVSLLHKPFAIEALLRQVREALAGLAPAE